MIHGAFAVYPWAPDKFVPVPPDHAGMAAIVVAHPTKPIALSDIDCPVEPRRTTMLHAHKLRGGEARWLVYAESANAANEALALPMFAVNGLVALLGMVT